MFYNFDEKAKQAIFNAQNLAKKFGQKYVGSEHLLLSISQIDSLASKKMKNSGIDLKELQEYIAINCLKSEKIYREKNKDYYKKLETTARKNKFFLNFRKFSNLIKKSTSIFQLNNKKDILPPLSPTLKKIFLRSYLHSIKKKHIVTIELLLALLLYKGNSTIDKILENYPIRRDKLIKELELETRKHYVQHFRVLYSFPEKTELINAETQLANLISEDTKELHSKYIKANYKLLKTTLKKNRIKVQFLNTVIPKTNFVPGIKALAFFNLTKKNKQFSIKSFLDEITLLKDYWYSNSNPYKNNKDSSLSILNKGKNQSIIKSFYNEYFSEVFEELFLNKLYKNIEIPYSLEYDYYKSYKSKSKLDWYFYKKIRKIKFKGKKSKNLSKWKSIIKRRIKMKDKPL